MPDSQQSSGFGIQGLPFNFPVFNGATLAPNLGLLGPGIEQGVDNLVNGPADRAKRQAAIALAQLQQQQAEQQLAQGLELNRLKSLSQQFPQGFPDMQPAPQRQPLLFEGQLPQTFDSGPSPAFRDALRGWMGQKLGNQIIAASQPPLIGDNPPFNFAPTPRQAQLFQDPAFTTPPPSRDQSAAVGNLPPLNLPTANALSGLRALTAQMGGITPTTAQLVQHNLEAPEVAVANNLKLAQANSLNSLAAVRPLQASSLGDLRASQVNANNARATSQQSLAQSRSLDSKSKLAVIDAAGKMGINLLDDPNYTNLEQWEADSAAAGQMLPKGEYVDYVKAAQDIQKAQINLKKASRVSDLDNYFSDDNTPGAPKPATTTGQPTPASGTAQSTPNTTAPTAAAWLNDLRKIRGVK